MGTTRGGDRPQLRGESATRSHAELDEATELDAGDLDLLAAGHQRVRRHLTRLSVLRGCCGTDSRHVARLWQSP